MQKPVGHPPRFLDLLEEVYLADEKARVEGPLREVRHNPSSASIKKGDGKVVGACLRQLWYKATGVAESEPKQLTNYLQMDFGNAIHTVLQGKLGKAKGITFTEEAAGRVVVDGLTKEVSFRLDGLVNFRGEQGCLEIKTVQSFALTRMVKEKKTPKEADVLQVLSYFGTNPHLEWASLVYFGRDTAYRNECHIIKQPDGTFTQQSVSPEGPIRKVENTYEQIVQRWKEFEGYLEKKQTPPRDYKVVLNKEGKVVPVKTKNYVEYKSDGRCLNCNYKTTCWSEVGAEEDSYKVGFD